MAGSIIEFRMSSSSDFGSRPLTPLPHYNNRYSAASSIRAFYPSSPVNAHVLPNLESSKHLFSPFSGFANPSFLNISKIKNSPSTRLSEEIYPATQKFQPEQQGPLWRSASPPPPSVLSHSKSFCISPRASCTYGELVDPDHGYNGRKSMSLGKRDSLRKPRKSFQNSARTAPLPNIKSEIDNTSSAKHFHLLPLDVPSTIILKLNESLPNTEGGQSQNEVVPPGQGVGRKGIPSKLTKLTSVFRWNHNHLLWKPSFGIEAFQHMLGSKEEQNEQVSEVRPPHVGSNIASSDSISSNNAEKKRSKKKSRRCRLFPYHGWKKNASPFKESFSQLANTFNTPTKERELSWQSRYTIGSHNISETTGNITPAVPYSYNDVNHTPTLTSFDQLLSSPKFKQARIRGATDDTELISGGGLFRGVHLGAEPSDFDKFSVNPHEKLFPYPLSPSSPTAHVINTCFSTLNELMNCPDLAAPLSPRSSKSLHSTMSRISMLKSDGEISEFNMTLKRRFDAMRALLLDCIDDESEDTESESVNSDDSVTSPQVRYMDGSVSLKLELDTSDTSRLYRDMKDALLQDDVSTHSTEISFGDISGISRDFSVESVLIDGRNDTSGIYNENSRRFSDLDTEVTANNLLNGRQPVYDAWDSQSEDDVHSIATTILSVMVYE